MGAGRFCVSFGEARGVVGRNGVEVYYPLIVEKN